MSDAAQPCKHCQRPLVASAEALRQNPYCSVCLNERLALAKDASPVDRWEMRGKYAHPIRRDVDGQS